MAAKGQAVFHSGALFVAGSDGSVTRGPTISDISLDAKGSIKKLMGENTFAEAIGRGSVDITGKFKINRTNLRFSNAAFFNQTLTTDATSGRELVSDEAKTAVASKFIVTAAGAIGRDLGLINATTGEAYAYIVSGVPQPKQYTINFTTGEYTVPAADATEKFLVTYMKKVPGQVLTINNTLAGEAPTFELVAVNKFQQHTKTIELYSCVSESFAEAWKNDDFSGQDYSFSVQADAARGVGKIYTTLQS
jgi:hypothetical protein